MTEDLITTEQAPRRTPRETPSRSRQPRFPWPVVVVGGLILGLVGWVDVLALWYPWQLGNREWEFATASGTFNALPLATIGTLVLAAAALWTGKRKTAYALAGLMGIVAVVLAGVLVLFGLSWLEGRGAVGPDVRWILARAGVKTGLMGLAYIGLFGWLSLYTIRSAKRGRHI